MGGRRSPRVSRIRHQDNSLIVEGSLGGRHCYFTIDTDANVSVVRPDVVRHHTIDGSSSRIRTANGQEIFVLGKAVVRIILEACEIDDVMVVAEIVNEVILDVDFMVKHAVVIDVQGKTLTIGNEEIAMALPSAESERALQICLVEDVELPARCENITQASQRKPTKDASSLRYGMVESDKDQVIHKGVVATRTFVTVSNHTLGEP